MSRGIQGWDPAAGNDGQQGFGPLIGVKQSNGGVKLVLDPSSVASSSGGSGTSNTVAPTAAGTSATTANPVQGVTGGIPFAVIGTFFQATQPVSLTALPALAAGSNAIGTVGVTSLPALSTGSNAIGTVGVTTLPALPAGNNAIGTVGVTALPALPTGSNAIGTVGVTALPALPTGANTIGNVGINSPLPTGTNALGTVGVTALPALPTGANTIGNVVPLMGGAAVTNANPLAVANIVGGAVVSATNPIPVINPVIGIGAWQLIPTTGTTGTPVIFGTKPSGAIGVELYLPSGSSVNANIDTSVSNAAAQITAGIIVQYDYATLGKIVQVNLGTNVNLYESAITGAPYFRWI